MWLDGVWCMFVLSTGFEPVLHPWKGCDLTLSRTERIIYYFKEHFKYTKSFLKCQMFLHIYFCTRNRSRTCNLWLLRPLRMPIPPYGHFGWLMGFEPILSVPQTDVLTTNTINTIWGQCWNRTNSVSFADPPASTTKLTNCCSLFSLVHCRWTL